MSKARDKCTFFVRIREFFRTSDAIDILFLVRSDFTANKIVYKVRN